MFSMRIDLHPRRRVVPLGILFALAIGCGGKDTSAPERTLASLSSVAGNQQQGTAGVVLPLNPTVEARDQDGAPMSNVSVRFMVTGGGALSDTIVGCLTPASSHTVWMWYTTSLAYSSSV